MKKLYRAVLITLALAVPTLAIGADSGVKAAAGGKIYKIADLYKKKDSLDKQAVTVRGKVTKVSAGIMNRNWIHLQDGSGSAASRDNDLTVTTNEELPAVGKTATVTGILAKNKDFGSGYFYTVILEQAKIKK